MNTFKSVQCSINYVWVCSIRNYTNLSSEGPVLFNVRSFKAKSGAFMFPYQKANTRGGQKNWTIMEITANFWKAKFLNPNDETHFDFLIGWIPRAHTECPASLLNNWAQATWALRVRPGDSSDQKIEMGFIIRDVKLSFVEICSNFHDVDRYECTTYLLLNM